MKEDIEKGFLIQNPCHFEPTQELDIYNTLVVVLRVWLEKLAYRIGNA